MKKILLILFVLCSVTSFGQLNRYTVINHQYKWEAGLFNGFNIPGKTDTVFSTYQWRAAGAAVVDSTGDKGLWVYWDNRWHKLVERDSTGDGAVQGFNDVLTEDPNVYASHVSDFLAFNWNWQNVGDFTIHSDAGSTVRLKLSAGETNLFAPNGSTGYAADDDSLYLPDGNGIVSDTTDWLIPIKSPGNGIGYIRPGAVGGVASLELVSQVGNSSTLNIISYDSLKGQDGRYNASVFIGEDATLRSDTLTALGSSITAHSGVTQAQGYVSLLATRMGLKERNLGQGGASIDYLISNLNLIPYKDATHRFLTLEFNMNDADDPDTAAWKVKMQRAIDTVFARDWNGDDDMLLIAGPFTEVSTVPFITDYVTATKTIGAINNIPVADAYTIMANNGGTSLTQDSVHPTVTGHYYIYQSASQAIPWDEYPGQLYVTGDAHISRTLFAGGDPSSIAYYKYNAAGVFNKTAHFLDDVFIGTDTTEISNSKINISTSSGQIGVGIKQAAVTTSSYHYAGQSQWINSSGQALTITPTTISVSSGNTEFIRQGGSSLWLGGYNGNNTFNDDAIDMDFIVKTDNDATALYGNGGTDQVIIGAATLNTSAKFGIVSTTKGFLPPVMTAAQEAAIGTPTAGLQVYQTDTARMRVYNGSAWKSIAYLDDLGAGGGGSLLPTSGTGTATAAVTGDMATNDLTIDNLGEFQILKSSQQRIYIHGTASEFMSPNGDGFINLTNAAASIGNGVAHTHIYPDSISLHTPGVINMRDASLGAASNGYVWTLANSSTGEGEWAAAGAASLAIGGSITGGTANSFLFEDASNQLAESPYFTLGGATIYIGESGTATGAIVLDGATSGSVGIQPQNAAGTWTLTLPTSGGTNGYFLQTNGSGVTTWAAAGGGSGDVTKVGTPVNNQIGVWTGDGTIEGDANFTWTGTEMLIGTSTDNGAYTAQVGGDMFIGGNTLKFGTTSNTRIVGITNGMYMLGNTQTALGIGASTYWIDIRSTGVYIGGSAAASNPLHVQSTTTPQVRMAYDGSNYFTTTISSAGAITMDATGASAGFTFSDAATFSSTVRLFGYTVATLPAAGTAGRMAYVTDALAPTYGATVVGGGAVVIPVFDDGTNWTAH